MFNNGKTISELSQAITLIPLDECEIQVIQQLLLPFHSVAIRLDKKWIFRQYL